MRQSQIPEGAQFVGAIQTGPPQTLQQTYIQPQQIQSQYIQSPLKVSQQYQLPFSPIKQSIPIGYQVPQYIPYRQQSPPQMYQLQQSPQQIIQLQQSPQQIVQVQQPQQIIQQPQIIQQNIRQASPQVVREIHHVERPLEVISIEEIEAPWRVKCATLERQILELQIQLRKGGGVPTVETVEVIDDSKVKELEGEKDDLEKKVDDKSQELEELKNQIADAQAHLEEIIMERTSYFTNELESWQKKYADLLKKDQELQNELQQINQQLAIEKSKQQAVPPAREEVRRQSKRF